MEEPSVLDYLKSKLKFWKHGEKIQIPMPEPTAPAPQPDEQPAAPARAFAWPWRSLLALGLALTGQLLFEPPGQAAFAGTVLYILGAALLIWATLRGEWTLIDLPVSESRNDPLTFRRLPMILAIIFTIVAFIVLNDNMFTWYNVTLWVAAIVCYVWAMWVKYPKAKPDRISATENGLPQNGNVLLNDKLGGTSVTVTSANQDGVQISIGIPFTTLHGGALTLNSDGVYNYTPPARDKVPPEGLKETFQYTITNENGTTSSSALIVIVEDSDYLPAPIPAWKRLLDFFKRTSWTIPVTRWTLVVLAVTALVIFFRVYHIVQTPNEPFSDHAEKILDVYDITQGQTHIYFTRNTGREGFQMYLTVVVAWLFQTGLSFLSLKIGTVLCGIATLPYMYLLGKEIGGKRVGLLAMLFFGIAYWPNVIARVGLRFPLYPLFAAPTLYYLLRGLRRQNRNDFIISGLFLGLGLHGYSPFRVVPVLVVVAIALYLLHQISKGRRSQTIIWLAVLALASLIVFLPLLRYAIDDPAQFGYRTFTRLGGLEQPVPADWPKILLNNFWNAARMFNWDDGEIWVNSVTHRPALDVVSGALFVFGLFLLIVRYVRSRNWLDLFLILSIPVLQLPSSLSIAFPNENPALNRASGAAVIVFVIVALALDSLMTGIKRSMDQDNGPMAKRRSSLLLWAVTGILLVWSISQNYDLVFKQYDQQYRNASLNSSEMGKVIKQFGLTYGETDTTWIVPFPYWVDTRLPGIYAGIPNRDFAIRPENLNQTLSVQGPKLFIVKADLNDPLYNDQASLDLLKQLYPQGSVGLFTSEVPGHDFWIYFVPAK